MTITEPASNRFLQEILMFAFVNGLLVNGLHVVLVVTRWVNGL